MKKKVDPRVRALIEAGVAENHRSLFVIVGDKGRHQIVNLHYILSKAAVKARPSVLWCYKKELGFSSHKQKRMKQLKKLAHRSATDVEKLKEDPFELFITSTKIRYCYYNETHKILGNTFGMCILQDFEAFTPNLLARTIETVEGGGIVVILLKTMDSLKQLYHMSMDVHSRFRTEAHTDVIARFNERFLLSLGQCQSALVLDDELNVLPLSSGVRGMLSQEAEGKGDNEGASKQASAELKELCDSLKDTQPIGSLVSMAKTIDQAKTLLTFMEAVSDKTLRSTVALTAGRGRGKSAALGMAIAGAVAYGYSNIFVTSPTPENLNTLFEFILKGFDALEYKEHLDYQVVQSSNPSFNNAIVRINVFHSHRQTIQYVQPQHSHYLSQAELVVVDEAAAIPLPLVKKLMGPYLLFMASTINGYEGTGRSLSLKLIQQLREQQVMRVSATSSSGDDSAGVVRAPRQGGATETDVQRSSGGRLLRELKLEVPIRYGPGDPVEDWLNRLLCLDATNNTPVLKGGCPHPSQCELYYVERDTLFSHHRAAEDFLQSMMSLYVASHYKNSPNDLQLLSDAPAHQLFVLLGPVSDGKSTPDILAVLQVCLEGQISKESVMNQLQRGHRAAGDLIPWTISQQFQDADFAALSGARIVRIATHPEVTKMGYGSRAMELLAKFYSGQLVNLDEPGTEAASASKGGTEKGAGKGLLNEEIKARKELPPLLVPVASMKPPPLHYLGVSYGITSDLYRFWRRQGFRCTYVRQTASDLTGEHTCICIKQLSSSELENTTSEGWLEEFETDFKRRFINLMAYEFRNFHPALPLSVLDPSNVSSGGAEGRIESDTGKDKNAIGGDELESLFTAYDFKRLESYANNIVDHHVIVDLIPPISKLYFQNRIPVSLSFTQAATLLAMGLQHKSIDDLQTELKLEARQLLANFNKMVVRINKFFRSLREEAAGAELSAKKAVSAQPLKMSLDAELSAEGKKVSQAMKKAAEEVDGEYEIPQDDKAWEAALSKHKGKSSAPMVVSVPKRKAQTPDKSIENDDDESQKRKKKKKSFQNRKSM